VKEGTEKANLVKEVLKRFAPSAGKHVKCHLNPQGTALYIAGIASPSAKVVRLKAGGTAGQEAAGLTGNAMAGAILITAHQPSATAKKDFN
jgi:hypothetical protein